MTVIRSLIIALFMVSLSVLTYDSLPYFAISVYRPLAMFPMFLASLLMLFVDFRFKKGDFFLIGFCIYSICHTLIICMTYGSLSISFKHIMTLLFGLSMYRVSVYMAEQARSSPAIRKAIVNSLIIAFIPPILVGIFQFADSFFIKSGFSTQITGYFSQKVYLRRIQLLSGEPSWAAIHVLSGGFLMYYLYRLGYKKVLLPLIAITMLMMLSFSAYAYSVILIALVIYLLITSKNRGKMLVLLGVCTVAIVYGIPFLLETFKIGGYFANRFQFDFQALYQKDNSVFVRVVFPSIGFIEFLKHPVFGVGGGYFYTQFVEILHREFSSGLKFKEVYDLVYVHTEQATSRNLFSKLLSEEGIIGFSLFMCFLITIGRGSSPFAKFALALCLSMVMNFDSYSFINFWILMGFIRGGFFNLLPDQSIIPTQSLMRSTNNLWASVWRVKA